MGGQNYPGAAHWIQAADEMWFPRSLLSNLPQHLRENRAAWEKRKWASDCVSDGRQCDSNTVQFVFKDIVWISVF